MLSAGLVLSLSLCLSGCSVGLKDAYSLKERIPSIEASFAAEEEAAAKDLLRICVFISDEGSFNPEDVTSQAGALFDLTDREVLYSKDAFEKLYPASITKVMTALMAIKWQPGRPGNGNRGCRDHRNRSHLMRDPAWRHFDIRAAFIWSDASFRK